LLLTVSSWWGFGSVTMRECNCSSSVDTAVFTACPKAASLDLHSNDSFRDQTGINCSFVGGSFFHWSEIVMSTSDTIHVVHGCFKIISGCPSIIVVPVVFWSGPYSSVLKDEVLLSMPASKRAIS